MVQSNGQQTIRVLDVELFQELRESLGDELGIVIGLYRRFLSTTAGTLAELRKQTAQNMVEARARSLHALKGSASMVGANRIAAVAAELQDSILHAPAAIADSGIDALEGELTLFRVALDQHLASLDTSLESPDK